MSLPTVKQLRFLVALDEYHHFGRAAESCYLSQSAFSLAIKDLETRLGARLVDRTNRSVIFTDIGHSVVDQARRCLAEMDALVRMAENRQEPLSGRLTLGVIPTIAPFFLPLVLPAVYREFPDLQLYLREDKTLAVHEQLLQGKLDLMLVALPFELKHVVTMPLFKDPFLLACRHDSRWLTSSGENPDVQSLPAESVLLLDDGHCLREHALQACRFRDTERISRFSATSLQTLLQMVAADLGVTFIPCMARHASLPANIKVFDMPDTDGREIALAWRKGSGREEEFRLFGELLKSCR